MTSIKLKFRPSKNPAKEGTLVFQLIHRRKVCRISSNCKIFNHEWDEESGQILLSSPESLRHGQLNLIRSHVEWEMQRLRKIADELEQTGGNWRAGDISKRFASCIDASQSVFNFIHAQILRKKQLGKMRCSETYQTTLNSFMRFRKGMDLTFGMIDSELMELYEAELRGQGLLRNTTSFYMRILRTNYRLAVELSYRRKKTGQLLTIEWTEQMQAILDKYQPNPTLYLLPIILKENGNERRQYQNQMMKINRRLKDIAALTRLSVPLSLYYSRHSWATIARRKDIPLAIISEGLGHDSEATTQIYLDSIKSWEVDKANRKILNGL